MKRYFTAAVGLGLVGAAFGRGESWVAKPPAPPAAATLTNEARYLEWKWRTDVTDAGTGVDNAALKAGAAKIAAELKARPVKPMSLRTARPQAAAWPVSFCSFWNA